MAGVIGIGGASSRGGDYAIEVTLPRIPLFVELEARRAINTLCIQTLRLALQTAAGYIADEAPVDSGALGQSFMSDPATTTGGLELIGVDASSAVEGRIFTSLPYALAINDGRRPGAPISRAGIDALGLWAQRKLGLSADEAQSAKWAIATMIVRRGLEARHYFDHGVAKATPTVTQLFAALSQAIADELTRTGADS